MPPQTPGYAPPRIQGSPLVSRGLAWSADSPGKDYSQPRFRLNRQDKPGPYQADTRSSLENPRERGIAGKPEAAALPDDVSSVFATSRGKPVIALPARLPVGTSFLLPAGMDNTIPGRRSHGALCPTQPGDLPTWNPCPPGSAGPPGVLEPRRQPSSPILGEARIASFLYRERWNSADSPRVQGRVPGTPAVHRWPGTPQWSCRKRRPIPHPARHPDTGCSPRDPAKPRFPAPTTARREAAPAGPCPFPEPKTLCPLGGILVVSNTCGRGA